MRALMHACCANCALYPVRKMKKDGIKVNVLWFNPNIHPSEEYLKRMGALRELEVIWSLDIIYKDHYGLLDFLQSVGERRADGERCRICYRMRMDEAAKTARELGFEAFTTSLLVSPYQKFDLLVEEARRAEEAHGVMFHFEDFRPGYREGVALSRELGLYRQKYCGCIFSEMERSYAKKDRLPK